MLVLLGSPISAVLDAGNPGTGGAVPLPGYCALPGKPVTKFGAFDTNCEPVDCVLLRVSRRSSVVLVPMCHSSLPATVRSSYGSALTLVATLSRHPSASL